MFKGIAGHRSPHPIQTKTNSNHRYPISAQAVLVTPKQSHPHVSALSTSLAVFSIVPSSAPMALAKHEPYSGSTL